VEARPSCEYFPLTFLRYVRFDFPGTTPFPAASAITHEDAGSAAGRGGLPAAASRKTDSG